MQDYMRLSTYKKISKGEIRGWIAEEIYDHLFFIFSKDPVAAVQETGGAILKDSRWRWAALFCLPDGRRVFFKRDKTKGRTESVKYLFLPSKGQKEFFISFRLQNKGVNIPKPFGWAERVRRGFVEESYYLSEAIGSGVSFVEDRTKSKEPFSIIELAKTVKKIQEAGLFHQDLHAGNFLWEGDSLFLTDLHRAKILKTLSFHQRLWNLSHLFHSLRSSWKEEEQIKFIEKYFEGEPIYSQNKERLLQKIDAFMEGLQRKQWRSRTKRCVKESTEFSMGKEKGVHYYHRRDVPMDTIKRVIETHRQVVIENPSLLIKNAPEVAISLLDDEKGKVCVKQFRYPSVMGRIKEYFRRSKGYKSWMAANGLRTRGIPSIKTLAMVERRGWLGLKESFLLMEASIENLEMDRFILKGFKNLNEKRLFIESFAQWLSGFHQMGLFHKDMKTCNVLVFAKEGAWNFYLLDMEDIQLNEKVDWKKLFRNFLQLNTSTPKVMTKVDRFRFLREYLHFNPIVKDQKVFIRKLVDESHQRGLVYVSPGGVVTETM
jgi:tRNA A-37 threonylcarbamoyl transferase component Bud32